MQNPLGAVPTRVQAPEGAVTSKVQAPRGALTIYIHYFRCLLCVYVITETSAASCRKSLGMHSGAIPDEAITASSSYDSVSVGPAFGRFAYTYTPVSSLSLLTFSTTNMFILL